MGICDRILVMSGGRLAGELDGNGASQEDIMTLAAKIRLKEKVCMAKFNFKAQYADFKALDKRNAARL